MKAYNYGGANEAKLQVSEEDDVIRWVEFNLFDEALGSLG